MSRLIDADALHRELVVEMVKCMRMSEETKGSMSERILNRLDEAPTIDAVPVVHGRWIIEGREFSVMGKDGFIRSERKLTFTCSNPKCGVGIVGLENMNYCPNCGAKMDLEVDGDD